MSLSITAAQRDALYDQILDRLSGIGDIALAIERENYAAAERVGMRQQAESHTASLEAELTQVGEIKERNRLVSEACATVLADLGRTGDSVDAKGRRLASGRWRRRDEIA